MARQHSLGPRLTTFPELQARAAQWIKNLDARPETQTAGVKEAGESTESDVHDETAAGLTNTDAPTSLPTGSPSAVPMTTANPSVQPSGGPSAVISPAVVALTSDHLPSIDATSDESFEARWSRSL